MTKLKTLKDLEFDYIWNGIKKPKAVWSDDLRQEAIKWIKAEKSVYINAEKFFNIREKDLK